MANHENDWNRNERFSDQGRNHDDRSDRKMYDSWNDQFERRRYEGGNNDQWSNDNYDRGRSSSNAGGSYRDSNDQNERWRRDNDNSNQRGQMGNSTGVNRGSGNYQEREQGNWSSSGRSNRGYGGQDYGYDRNRFNNNQGNNDRNWFDKTADEVSSWFGDEEAARRRKMDEVKGLHKGKGPKSYTRSDERIQDDVNDRLSDDDNVDASEIEVAVSKGEVTLTGTVASRWEKRRAEDIAESVSGVKDVENRIKVSSNRSSGDQGGTNDSGSNSGTFGVPYGSSGAAPVGAFDIGKS